jgi:hypothetical protein
LGFPELAAITDVEQRALVSDQLLSAADGMLDDLVDSAISRWKDWTACQRF